MEKETKLFGEKGIMQLRFLRYDFYNQQFTYLPMVQRCHCWCRGNIKLSDMSVKYCAEMELESEDEKKKPLKN